MFYWLESLTKKAQKNKEALDDCIEQTRSIEIHFQEEGCKPLLSKVHFPFDDSVSMCLYVSMCVCVHLCVCVCLCLCMFVNLFIKHFVCGNCQHFNNLSKCVHLTLKKQLYVLLYIHHIHVYICKYIIFLFVCMYVPVCVIHLSYRIISEK